jgi:hypothetical protein
MSHATDRVAAPGGEVYKNFLSCAGIFSTSRSAPTPRVTASDAVRVFLTRVVAERQPGFVGKEIH